MKNFIERTDVESGLISMRRDLDYIVGRIGWPKKISKDGKTLSSNQIGLTHRPGAENQSMDNIGSLYMQTAAKESEFTEFHEFLGSYTRDALSRLCEEEGVCLGRVRYMLLPEKTGLTVHTDMEIRYHYALRTTPNAFFGEVVSDGEVSAKCYNIPSDGYFYRVDTTRPHFVYNGSREPRIHLVITTI
jgi:hypothetical protein